MLQYEREAPRWGIAQGQCHRRLEMSLVSTSTSVLPEYHHTNLQRKHSTVHRLEI